MENINTILFDIGWPIIDETLVHQKWNEHLMNRVSELQSRKINFTEIEKYENDAVTCYAPSLFSYVIWQLVQPNFKHFFSLRSEFDLFDFAQYSKIQPDARDVVEKLQGHFKLGLAANQPSSVHDFLEKEGFLKYFSSMEVSEDIGYSKPDIRMFERVLNNLGSKPEEAMMIGDRQDNDIVPAKLVGMKTIRLLIGPHKHQKIRYPNESPDYEIYSIKELLSIPLIANKLGDLPNL